MGNVININNDANTEIITEDNITLKKLESIFKQAFYKVDKDEKYITVHSYYRIYIHINPETKLLRYSVSIKVPKKCNNLPKALSDINNKVNFARLCCYDDGDVYTEYYIDYTVGLTLMHIISSMRRLENTSRTMLEELFKIIDKQIDVKSIAIVPQPL